MRHQQKPLDGEPNGGREATTLLGAGLGSDAKTSAIRGGRQRMLAGLRPLMRALVAAMLVVYVGWLILGLVRSADWVDVGSASLIVSSDVTYVPRHHVFVASDGPRLIAFSAVSPHQGNLGRKGFGTTAERVLYCASNETFVEQVHGSSWDTRGRYVDGPAPRGMTTVALRIREGRVEVAPARWSPGPGRDIRGRPGLGAYCTGDVLVEESPGFARTGSST